MGSELFSIFVFTVLMLACFKPLSSTYFRQNITEHNLIQQQRDEEKKAFIKELREITSRFDSKFADAIRGKLNK